MNDATLPETGPAEDRLFEVSPIPPAALGELEPAGDPLLTSDGRVRLSFSRVDMYRQCPARFRYSYVDGMPRRPSPHLSFGTSVHNALEQFYDRKLPLLPSEQELLEGLYHGWESSGFAELTRDEQLRWYRQAQDVLRRYHRRVAGVWRPAAAVEQWFEMPVGDEAVVVGSIDRVDVDDDGRFSVVDYKTNRTVGPRQRVSRSLQLGIYALACEHLYGDLPKTVALDFVVPGVEIVVPVDELDLEAVRAAVLGTARRILDQRFEPMPDRRCSWCDFRGLCPAWQGEGPDVLGPAVEELDRLRGRIRRDVAAMRQLEEAVERARRTLAQQPAPPASPDEPAQSIGPPAG